MCNKVNEKIKRNLTRLCARQINKWVGGYFTIPRQDCFITQICDIIY